MDWLEVLAVVLIGLTAIGCVAPFVIVAIYVIRDVAGHFQRPAPTHNVTIEESDSGGYQVVD